MNICDVTLYEESGGYARKFVKHARIIDSNGCQWVYDTSYAKELRMPECDDVPGNGYSVDSFEQAVVTLFEGGYI